MKLNPKIYAQTLLSALEEKPDQAQTIARNFWYELQKNGQEKDIKKILELLEEENAERSGAIFAKVYSEEALSEAIIAEINLKIEKKFNKPAQIKNIVKKNLTGIIVKVNDTEIDLSLEGKIQQLRTKLIRQ